MKLQINQEKQNVRFRHLRCRNSKVPVATIATIERDNKVVAGFSFCDKNDIFTKKRGRETSGTRIQKYLEKGKENFVFEMDRDVFLALIEKIKTGKRYYTSVAYRKSILNFLENH